MMRKYKHFKGHKTIACRTLRLLAKEKPNLFAHWKAGYILRRLDDGSCMSREAPVQFCEGLEVKFLRSTHLYK